MGLIHNAAYFSEESVRERAKQYGFSDPLPVELFLWDCEIAAQLQSESDDFVLKGGAAAQLHLPVGMQRGSVDVDVVCPFTEHEVAEALSRIHEKVPPVEFVKYTPKRPTKDISMVTYLAKMPPLIPSDSGRLREVKIDFLLEDLNVPTQNVADVETFSLKVKRLTCYSVSSLLGDKLLTLAENTIGISEAIGIPKQIYDVSVLSEAHQLTAMQFSEIIAIIEKVVPLEAGYRGLEITVPDALGDVERTMDKYGLLDTTGADAEIKKNVMNFQEFYVSTSQKWPWYEWCARALRIRFLSQVLNATFEKKIDVKEAFNEYTLAVKIAQLLKAAKGETIKVLTKKLMDSADKEIPYFRNLKGKPLHRVFWQVVTRNNLNAIHDLVRDQVG
jgi:hypothetical protein